VAVAWAAWVVWISKSNHSELNEKERPGIAAGPLCIMGSIPPKSRDTMTSTNYQEGYHENPRIPGNPGERPRSLKCDFCPSLLTKMNVSG
jgi:hypothetical protein